MGAAASQSCIPCTGGGCLGLNDGDDARLSRGIDKGLRETRRTLQNTSKILLLGSGDSGKSTIIKQMRIINNVPFTEYEREIYRVQLFYNLVGGMRALLDALRDLPPLEADGAAATGGEDVGEGGGETTGAASLPKFTNMAPPPRSEESDSSRASSPSPQPKSKDAKDTDQSDLVLDISAAAVPTTSQDHSSDPNASATLNPNDPTLADPATNNPDRPPSRTPTRSPSISLNLFNPGSLTPRQLTLLNEFMYAPDLRPGQGFPLEFEGMLREAWWGIGEGEWEVLQGNANANAHSTSSAGVGFNTVGSSRARGRNQVYEEQTRSQVSGKDMRGVGGERRGVGAMLDRIERELGVALPDNLTYLYENPMKLASFFEEDYVPSDADILRCRCRTTGIQETVFSLAKGLMQGQGGVRRKGSLGGLAFKGGGSSANNAANSNATANPTSSNNSYRNPSMSSPAIPGSTYTNSPIKTNPTTTHANLPPRNDLDSELGPLKISVGKTKLHMVDVGGQRSERRKWIHCFQDVTAVLFLVGLSGYNQGLVEDTTANQMQDAMALWDGVCSSPWLKNTSLILFLNKTDLFAQKVGKFPISDYFPDYEGEKGDVKAGMEYFKRRFMRVAAKSMKHSRQSRSRKDSRAVTDSSTAVGSTKSRQDKSKPREKSKPRDKGKPEEQLHIATNTTSSHGVSTGVSFDSPRKAPVSGALGGNAYAIGGSGVGGLRGVSGIGPGAGNPRGKGKEREVVRDRTVYTHFTNATDTNQLRVVIVAVCDIILRDNFAHANLI